MESFSATEEAYLVSLDGDNSTVDPYKIDIAPYFVVLNTVYYAILGPVAITGNILSVLVTQRILSYRKSIPDMLTGCLAAIDLLCVISTHTPSVISLARGQWTGGSPICSYQYFMAWSCLKTSFFIIILLTVDRYLALVKPFYYRAKVTPRQMKIALACLTVFSFAGTSVTIIWFSDEISLLPNWYLCMNTWGKGNEYYSYILAFYGMTFIVGVILFNVCNTGIVCSLIRHSKKGQRMKLRVLSAAQYQRERRVAKVIETLSVVFMLFWMPYLVFIILHQYNLFYSEFAEDLAIRVLFANTLLNPVVYGLFNRTYRKAYVYFIRKLLYYALCGKIKKPKVWTGSEHSIGRGSAKRVKNSPERKIYYLRRSYLQRRYARKTHSHGKRGQPEDTTQEVSLSEFGINGNTPQDIDITPADSMDELSVSNLRNCDFDNTGFTLNSQEDLIGANEDSRASNVGIFTISNRENLEERLNCKVNKSKSHSNGRIVGMETVTSLELETTPAYNDAGTESTWL
ncbi:C-C chemokine receptor type 5-like isoform X2 [Acanthaster planci]|uniref:C-C chemokine receptor type 5-like isoform X2 n=1 Tax=Acanthaster planci TaxID=133434 RepID=A0A8B7YU46_ACAPL|nr:C-C chemokine receptor type 5-like isoform X2 [Acanthaster planci]